MRILMLGNSFTYFNDMPKILAAMLGEEVVSRTKGGAYLREQLDPESELGAGTLRALREEHWDYVVLQEQSIAPVVRKEDFQSSVRNLCELIRAAGAKPLLYASWAYQEGSEKLAATGMSFDEMHRALYSSYHEAAEQNGALIADVGESFAAVRQIVNLYVQDAYHPSEAGSVLAAATIARAIESDRA